MKQYMDTTIQIGKDGDQDAEKSFLFKDLKVFVEKKSTRMTEHLKGRGVKEKEISLVRANWQRQKRTD